MKRTDNGEEKEDTDAPLKKIRENIAKVDGQIVEANVALMDALAAKDRYITELMEAIAVKEHTLEEDRKVFELSTQRVAESALPERIKLDVGGRIFSVTLEMMQRFPNSYFARLVSGRWSEKKTEDGAFFINRSGRLFDHIADFLRDGELNVSLCEEDRDALYKEADYYQLKLKWEEVEEDWDWEGGLKKHTGSNGLTSSMGTIGWDMGIHEWKLQISGHMTQIRIGITSSASNETVFKLSCNDGEVWAPIIGKWLHGILPPGLDGSIISVRLDMDKHELTYGMNGKWGRSISVIPHMKWFPFVMLGSDASVVRIK